ncbi:hypothetical protein MLD38_010739 [Melastoma candidum]|uniref:Uncharacterized protein n=1 Tax=Melastoma candidum TaxID=119954 RepID=A0ACB9R0V7_9MYRT|nr:hypothetical protein MLD38_010739 [Melastoma candidum]
MEQFEKEISHRTVAVNGIKVHIAEKGKGPVVLLLHGFPQTWYAWRHQIIALADLGYHAVAPDLRGFGDSDAPTSPSKYTSLHVVGDLLEILDAVAAAAGDKGKEKQVYVVGHDWGAIAAWYLCLYRPDRVKALVNMSVAFNPRNPTVRPIDSLRRLYGEDYYVCRFQEPGMIEAEFAKIGTKRVLENFLTYRDPGPLYLKKGEGFGHPTDVPITLPSWLSSKDVDHYSSKFEKTGFTGSLNYYRAIDLNWELTAPWTGAQINVPVKFIIGNQDLTYNMPGAKDFIHKGTLKKYVPLLDDVVVMDGAAHFIHEERPQEVTQLIHGFFQKIQVSRSSTQLTARKPCCIM